MLKYSINNRNAVIRYDELTVSGFVQYDENHTADFVVSNYGNLYETDIFSIQREDGFRINFKDRRYPNTVAQSGETQVVNINEFFDISLHIVSAETIEVSGETDIETYYLFKFDLKHNAITNFATNPRLASANIDKGTFYIYDESQIEELCVGDLFVKDDYFLYLRTESGYTFVSEPCTLYWRDTNGVEYESEGFVPCAGNGAELERYLMFPADSELKRLYNNYSTFSCRVKDLRFFWYEREETDEGTIWHLTIKPGVTVSVRRGDFELSMPLDTIFSPYLLANDGIDTFLKEEAEKRINTPIDYEKQQFVPVVYSDAGNCLTVNKITFNIHLRSRDENWDIIPDEEWAQSTSADNGDNLLDNYDFTSEDIYYQRKCVSETFLKISFYDTMSRGTQKLLYTARLQLDKNRLWKEYVENKNTGIGVKINFYFVCTNKYDYSNKTEGFYLYLFPSNVKELKDGAAIYARFELCHAKYGKTVLLTQPVYPNKEIPVSQYSGKTYTKEVSGRTFTDMEELNEDIYVKIRLKYDEDNFRYVWFFDGAHNESDAKNLIINLYEPKIV